MDHIKQYLPGDAIGPYVVKDLLGGGGSGHVYLATSMTGHDFAVKVCKQDLREVSADERREHVGRLTREFNILQTLSHENIVRVFGFGWTDENDDGLSSTPYSVMEVVPGINLDKVLKEQQLPLMVLMEIFRKLVGAVAYLHKKQVIHRDIKPSNVIIRENGSPVLLDFGVVRAPWFETLTRPCQVIGTYLFMSPESVRCCLTEGVYRPRSTDDVYALGVMLYRMLTGAMPPRGAPLQLALGRDTPPKHPCEIAPRTPRPLGDLAMRMLEADPARRLQNGKAVLDELEPLLVELQPHLFAPAPERVTEPLSTLLAPANEPAAFGLPAGPGTQDEEGRLAAIVVSRLLPWLGGGIAVLASVMWLLLHYPQPTSQRVPTDRGTVDDIVWGNEEPRQLGQSRLPFLNGQAQPPCEEPAEEQDGGCWIPTMYKPPCKGRSWEKDGKCWVPAPRGRTPLPQSGDGARQTPPSERRE